jgi:hypothetical protein
MLTGKSVSGVLHLFNKTPVNWYGKKGTSETATYGSQYVKLQEQQPSTYCATLAQSQGIDCRQILYFIRIPGAINPLTCLVNTEGINRLGRNYRHCCFGRVTPPICWRKRKVPSRILSCLLHWRVTIFPYVWINGHANMSSITVLGNRVRVTSLTIFTVVCDPWEQEYMCWARLTHWVWSFRLLYYIRKRETRLFP